MSVILVKKLQIKQFHERKTMVSGGDVWEIPIMPYVYGGCTETC